MYAEANTRLCPKKTLCLPGVSLIIGTGVEPVAAVLATAGLIVTVGWDTPLVTSCSEPVPPKLDVLTSEVPEKLRENKLMYKLVNLNCLNFF